MLKMIFAILIACVASMASNLTPSGSSFKCDNNFRDDTLLMKYYATQQNFLFCKDSGETLGVAAVKLQLKEIDQASDFYMLSSFTWGGGESDTRSGTVGQDNYQSSPGQNGFLYVDGFGNMTMALSGVGADRLDIRIDEAFFTGGNMDTVRAPAVGDTLHWSLSLIYFHSSRMPKPILGWTSKAGTTPSWEGSDTVTIRFRTIMKPIAIDVGLHRSSSPSESAVLGRYDAQGRPLDDKAIPSGLIFERTKEGIRKRLQLR